MRLVAFRIRNFRSVVDTQWIEFSPDRVTVLVGQNESGKTSILEALASTFSSVSIKPDDKRIDEPLPKIAVRLEVARGDLQSQLTSNYDSLQVEALNEFIGEKALVDFVFEWLPTNTKNELDLSYYIDNPQLELMLSALAPLPAPTLDLPKVSPQPTETDSADSVDTQSNEEVAAEPPEIQLLDRYEVAEVIFRATPTVVLFKASSGLLPNEVDIDTEKREVVGDGAVAAKNFLIAAQIKLEDLLKADLRERRSILERANDRLSADFSKFWRQTIGKTRTIKIECNFETRGAESGKAGAPYLVFWITDGPTRLYPEQRSQGVRWFVSFYLQLRASERGEKKLVFLLDEPGANLHSKAQGDVLSLINKLSDRITIVYTSHSPHMIEYDKIYRVRAVQRKDDLEDSPTEIIDALHLGAASTDTLSPVLTAMGAYLSNQQVIKSSDNVLLEESSGYFYLVSFWELTKERQKAHFISATGAGKVEVLANMFIGWGLDFVVAVDDDGQGRSVYNSLKKNLYGDDDALAAANVTKLPSGSAIEDTFTKGDFTKWVAQQPANPGETNSDIIRRYSLSKPVLGYRFLLSVRDGSIKFSALEKATQESIKSVVKAIATRLQAKAVK